MKQTQKFVVDVTISQIYGSDKGKVLGYARVIGTGYWDKNYQEDWDNQECELDSIASFDIDDVILKVGTKEQNVTLAYRACKDLGDTFAENIDKATLGHMQYLFCDTHHY